MGAEAVFVAGSQVMLMLLVHAPHTEWQGFQSSGFQVWRHVGVSWGT